MGYLIAKSLHIIGVVSWFAGLLYLVRLFVYYREAEDRSGLEQKLLRDQYELMIGRLYNIITTPAMILTVAAGVTMLFLMPALLHQGWMISKLVLVGILLVYHWYCGQVIRRIREGQDLWGSFRFRLFNEVATILLVAIVFLVVMKNTFNALYGIAGFIVFAVVLFVAASWYKSRRESKYKKS